MAIIEVDEESFSQAFTEAFEREMPVILKFGSEYCSGCQALDMELEELADSQEDLTILSIDTDESPELAEEYDIFTLPTLVIYDKDQTILYQKEGIILAEDINQIINFKEQ